MSDDYIDNVIDLLGRFRREKRVKEQGTLPVRELSYDQVSLEEAIAVQLAYLTHYLGVEHMLTLLSGQAASIALQAADFEETTIEEIEKLYLDFTRKVLYSYYRGGIGSPRNTDTPSSDSDN